jgi:hypothetical protein
MIFSVSVYERGHDDGHDDRDGHDRDHGDHVYRALLDDF